ARNSTTFPRRGSTIGTPVLFSGSSSRIRSGWTLPTLGGIRRLRTSRPRCIPNDRLDTTAEIWLDRPYAELLSSPDPDHDPDVDRDQHRDLHNHQSAPGQLFHDLYR